tara:strand:- start:1542 stop:1748 length:207 start_codon:yes stop_codon:yes gene_type:complete
MKKSICIIGNYNIKLKKGVKMDNNLNKLKLIVAREQSYYNKNEPRDWKYYNAYMLVLNEIDKLLKEKK